MRVKLLLKNTIKGIYTVLKDAVQLARGQKTEYAIFQNAHRLEKGMCMSNSKPEWGWAKAYRLIDLIQIEKGGNTPNEMAISVGESVLSNYLRAKIVSDVQEDKDKAKEMLRVLEQIGNSTKNLGFGGTKRINRSDIVFNEESRLIQQKLFTSRHSIRDFDTETIETSDILKAVDLALCAPSACNRQANRVYAISAEEREDITGSKNDSNACEYLIITGCIDAFEDGEMFDWIVSTSIFAGYLSLALHSMGIGSCFYKKAIVGKSNYNERIKALCGIPENEQIIIEMAIGKYKDQFYVPISQRISADTIVKKRC